MTDYNNGDWWGWNGGECPLHPETKGEFVFADGCICSRKPAGEWQWDDKELPLIAFRVTEEYKEPREWFVYINQHGIPFIDRNKGESGSGEYILVREVLE